MTQLSPDTLADLLPTYYKRLFPTGAFHRWISYGNVNQFYFAHREFSFTLHDDIYVRYKSYTDKASFEKDLQKHRPVKIDIGAVYNCRPSDKHTVSLFTPLERELVFDIDMTDYDDVRTCCSGADVCTKCWQFMVIACKVLDSALREDFGYKHLLWVFSGRRGIHCWVCDEEARKLDVPARSAVAEYLQVVSGGEHKAKKVTLTGDKLHSSIRRAVNIVEKHFVPVCIEGQDILGTTERISKFLPLIPEETLRQEVEKLLGNYSTSAARWKAFTDHIANQTQPKKRRQFLVEEIMLQYCYPRLDINVTKGLNHLLKAPFCVHPKTGKICTPFNPRAAEKFNPDITPTIMTLIDEIVKYDAEAGKDNEASNLRRLKDYKKTSMNKSVVIFEEFVRNLEESWKGKKVEASDVSMQF